MTFFWSLWFVVQIPIVRDTIQIYYVEIKVKIEKNITEPIFFIFLFYLYIYPPDLQKSDGGVDHKVSNYPDLLPEMPRYCYLLVN